MNTNTLHSKILFKSNYEKLLLIESFLNQYVFYYDDFNKEFSFEEINENLFQISLVVSEDELYTPYTDLLFALKHAGEIIMFDTFVESNDNVGSIHRYEDQKFYSYFVKDKTDFEKREIANSAFDEDLIFPIYSEGEKCTIKTKLFGVEKTFDVFLDNINYGANHKKEKVTILKNGTVIELCNICINRLNCIVTENKCSFQTL